MEKPGTIAAVANALMAGVFVWAAVVQYNDSDGLAWMALYGGAAVCCIAFVVGRLPWWIPALASGGALIGAALMAPDVIGQIPWGQLVARFEMENLAVEQARELGGLLIVAVWAAGLAIASYPSKETRDRK